MVEYFRTDDVLSQESCVILQRGLDVGDGMKLIVQRVKKRVFMCQRGIKGTKEICQLGYSGEAK